MTQAEGSNAQILIGEESTYKTQPGTPAGFVLPFLSESLGQKKGLGESNVITNSRNPKQPFSTTKEVSGSISTELNPFMGLMLKHLLGTAAVAGSDPYTHTFSIGALPVGLWVDKGFTDISQYFLYNGVRVNSASFSFSGAGGVVPVTFDLMGAKRTTGSSAQDASPTDAGHTAFNQFEAAIEEGGSSSAIVSEVEFTVSNNLDGSAYAIGGAGERRSLAAGITQVSGTVTAFFENLTLYTKAVNSTESSLKITCTKGNGLGSAGNESIEFFIPELIYEENDPPIEGPQGVKVRLPFRAYYNNSSEASALQIILKNATASY